MIEAYSHRYMYEGCNIKIILSWKEIFYLIGMLLLDDERFKGHRVELRKMLEEKRD